MSADDVQAQDDPPPQGSDLVPWQEGAKGFGATIVTGGGSILAGMGKFLWDLPISPVDVVFGTKYSYASESIDQARAAGASPSDMYKEIGRNAITFGGRSLDQAWEEWNRTGDPTQFQQASGTFLIGAVGGERRRECRECPHSANSVGPCGSDPRRDLASTPTAEPATAPPAAEAVAPNNRGVWELGPGPRGEAIEGRLGQNLPQNFPTIDRFENGVATSIKSMDLSGSSYLDPANITRVGQGYIDKVAGFQGRNWAGTNIRPGDVTGRGLDLAVPPGTATPGQQQALQGLIGYGKQRGVNVRIVEIQ